MFYICKKIFLVALPVLILASMAIGITTLAGTNGQQIRFVCSQMNAGAVKGSSQNGRAATWQDNGNNGSFTTSGWWWKGWVRIHYWNRSQNRWYSQLVNVPQRQIGDIFEARC